MPEEDLCSKRKNVDLRLMRSKPTCEAGSVVKSFNEVDGHKCRNPLHNSKIIWTAKKPTVTTLNVSYIVMRMRRSIWRSNQS